jgi:CheY-like chemotaxis protein
MKPTAQEVLFLSALPAGCALHLAALRGQGMSVQVASDPEDALALLRRRPSLVLVDLIHGPRLTPRVVEALNREPRSARVVALHEGRLDSYLEQVEHLAVDGFCRLERGAMAGVAAD